MSVLQQRGITSPPNYGSSSLVTPLPPSALGAVENQIPEIYREWITPDIASRLTPNDIWQLQQNAQNLRLSQQGAEMLQPMRAKQPQLTRIQLVPASALGSSATPQ